jgi:putative membrane protein
MTENTDERILLARERTVLAKERNRLANERTFLAWTRTGLAMVGGGFAMVRLLTFQTLTHQILAQVIGGALLGLGVLIFALSFLDYRNSFKKLQLKNGFAGSVWTISAISFVLIVITLGFILIAARVVDWF